ncbi:alpha/beta hydrolase [Nocardiopsis dassonvillei]|uniref:alpha/beta hydrolase n=1 Tax=Nocardiopsis dassonvillei TaxID=2014 RepID=UPI0036375FC9
MSVESMSLGLPEDVDADPEVLRQGASDLLTTRQTMLGYSSDLDSGFWAAANEFTDTIAWDIRGASQSDIESWQAVGELLTYGSGALELYAEAVDAYREVREDVQGRWDFYKSEALSRIEENGADTLTFTGSTQEEAEREYLTTVRSTLLGEHQDARNDLDDATDDANDTLRNGPTTDMWQRFVDAGLMTGKEVDLFGGSVHPTVGEPPGEDWTPEQVAHWWYNLAPNQQDYAMEEYPDELRNLDGVPVVVRDELNRERLELELDRVTSAGMGHMTYSWEQLREIEEALASDDKYLIYFDPYANGAGEAAISTGNPDHADNVSTLVPGMLNDMGSMADDVVRSEAIYGEMRENRPDEDHASIVWMGYDAPLGGGFDPEQSAERLAAFQDGLRATHRGDEPSHNTVMGHSFGAFVAGAADNPDIGGGLDADSLVLLGGPGASVDNITELSTDTDDVHVVQGDDDWIRYLDQSGALGEHYGTPPDNDEFFENPDNPDETLGHRLDPEEKTGHSGYFEDEETLDYLGDVATGSG